MRNLLNWIFCMENFAGDWTPFHLLDCLECGCKLRQWWAIEIWYMDEGCASRSSTEESSTSWFQSVWVSIRSCEPAMGWLDVHNTIICVRPKETFCRADCPDCRLSWLQICSPCACYDLQAHLVCGWNWHWKDTRGTWQAAQFPWQPVHSHVHQFLSTNWCKPDSGKVLTHWPTHFASGFFLLFSFPLFDRPLWAFSLLQNPSTIIYQENCTIDLMCLDPPPMSSDHTHVCTYLIRIWLTPRQRSGGKECMDHHHWRSMSSSLMMWTCHKGRNTLPSRRLKFSDNGWITRVGMIDSLHVHFVLLLTSSSLDVWDLLEVVGIQWRCGSFATSTSCPSLRWLMPACLSSSPPFWMPLWRKASFLRCKTVAARSWNAPLISITPSARSFFLLLPNRTTLSISVTWVKSFKECSVGISAIARTRMSLSACGFMKQCVCSRFIISLQAFYLFN